MLLDHIPRELQEDIF